MRFLRVILGLCSLAFGLLCGVMLPFAIKSGDRPSIIILAVLTSLSLLLARRLWRRRPTSWRDDPATDKQKSFADSLGIKYPRSISKGELSDLISEVTGR